MIEARTGRRYETCIRCGVSWDVPLDLELPEGGYLCPGCRSWKRRREPIKEEEEK